MAIIAPCSCGKKLKLPDGSEGRRAKCPACQSVVVVPSSATGAIAPTPVRREPEVTDTYELADLAPAAAPPPVAIATPLAPQGEEGNPATKTRRLAGKPVKGPAAIDAPAEITGSSFYRAAALRVAQRDAVAERGPKPLFNAFGVDMTPVKCVLTAVLLLLLIAFPIWFFLLGPGVNARVLSAQTVSSTRLLAGLDTQEPYSLFTGTGNRSQGIKGPKLKNSPVAASTIDLMYTVGGGEELFLTRPDPTGKYMVVEAEVSHGLITAKDRLIDYKVVLNGDDFTIAPAEGAPAGVTVGKPKMLYARFDESLSIDLDGPNSMSHASLMPADVMPTREKLEQGRGGGAASGNIRYDNIDGVTGDFEFSSIYFMTGAPGARGLSATGHVTRFTPDGSEINYDYKSSTLDLTWKDRPGQYAWWSRGQFKQPESFNPWSKVKVTLLVERPQGDAPLTLSYLGEEVGTIKPVKAAKTAEKIAKTEKPKGSPLVQNTPTNNPVSGYLGALMDARKKARGVVAMSNMQQIGIAIGMYAEANKGQMPESLYDLRQVMPDIDGVLVNIRTGEKPGYIYQKPAENFGQISNPAAVPILWESDQGQKLQGGSILYADGHIESPLIPSVP